MHLIIQLLTFDIGGHHDFQSWRFYIHLGLGDLFVFGGFIVPLENFSYGDVTITGEGLSKTNIPPHHIKI